MLKSFDQELEQFHGFETDYVKILYYDLPANYSGTYQTFGYTRFCTILEGDKQITLKNRTFNYDKSQSLLLPSYSKVFMEISKPTKALVFELNDRLIEDVIGKVHLQRRSEVKFNPCDEVLVNNLEENIRSTLQPLLSSSNLVHKEPFLIDLYVQKLIYDLLNMEEASNIVMGQNMNPMDRAIQLMKNNVEAPFSSQALADTFNMSLSNFSHTFKKFIGVSPNKYMHQLKMDHARTLLTTACVTEVAYELGYENPSYFIRLFKDFYGITPKQYQLRHRI